MFITPFDKAPPQPRSTPAIEPQDTTHFPRWLLWAANIAAAGAILLAVYIWKGSPGI